MAGQFCNVLVGFDGSPDSTEALRVAMAIAEHHVAVMIVLRPSRHFEPASDDDGDEATRLQRLAESKFAEFRRAQPAAGALRTSVKTVVSGHDAVARVLSEYALAHGFGLLVLGRHGDRILRRSHLGRVAGAAAESAGVPVLLVSAP
jgi:nucleotide-binding universal stress UspA family protein